MNSENKNEFATSDTTNGTPTESSGVICEDIGKGKRTKAKLKEVIQCRKCWFSFRYTGNTINTQCPNCGNNIDARDRNEYSKNRKEHFLNLARTRKSSQESHRNLHKRALFVVVGHTNVKCSYCGCNDIRLLEINHKNGGGGKEMKSTIGTYILSAINLSKEGKL